MEKRPSLKDIARKVGVSTALVSYVLNNKKEGRISKSIADRIKDVARELNYRTNQIARSLKTSKTFTLGLIVADISNPFSSTLARIIEDEAQKKNYTVLFGSSDENADKCGRLIDTFLNRQVDGLIIAAPEHAEQQIMSLKDQHFPFVLIDRYFPSVNANYVALDNFNAAREGVQYLISQGRRRIAMIGFQSGLVHLQERSRGYKHALEENGISFDERLSKEVDSVNAAEEVSKALDDLLSGDSPIDAVFFKSNIAATIGLKHINTLPIKIPVDLSVMCFDETESLGLFYTPLPYIRQPMHQMGEEATRMLLNEKGTSDPEQLHLSAKLVIP